jgi:hypothetical protein
MNERYRFVCQTLQRREGFFVAAAEGGDGGDVADEERADEMIFAGAGRRYLIVNPPTRGAIRDIVSGLR